MEERRAQSGAPYPESCYSFSCFFRNDVNGRRRTVRGSRVCLTKLPGFQTGRNDCSRT